MISSLRKSYEFKKVFNNSQAFVLPFIVIYILENNTDTARLGLCVSKKIGNAVTRNRIKRRIRAAVRSLTHEYRGYDVVVVARKSIVSRPYSDILHALRKALSKIHSDEKTSTTFNKNIQACTVTSAS